MFCEKCGKEIAEGTVICMGCGCPVESGSTAPYSPAQTAAKKSFIKTMWSDPKKKIILIVIAAILAVGIIIGGYFLVNYVRVQNIVNKLEGNTYAYYDYTSYTYVEDTYEYKIMKFKDDMKYDYSYYYSSIDSGNEYTSSYSVKYELDGDIIIKGGGIDKYKVNMDKNGEINSITDLVWDEEYEKID